MTGLHGVLRQLEQQWAVLGVPVERVLNSGHGRDDTHRLLVDRLGFAADSALAWFGWHDGSPPGEFWIAAPTGAQILPLHDCLTLRDEMLSVRPSDVDQNEGPRWSACWLPLSDTGNGALWALDINSGDLLQVDWWSPKFATRVPGGLEHAVLVWLEALETGVYRWRDGRWQYDFLSLPLTLRASGLLA